MKEIVEKLLEAEKKANEMINSANSQATQLNQQTERELAKIRQDTIDAAKAEARNLIEQTQNNVNQEKTNRLRETEKQADKLISSKQKQVPELINKIIDLVTTVKI